MSQYAHGTSLAEKLKTDEFGPYFVPADNPKNGILGLEIIRVMFTELILVIKRVYFYGSEGSWNDTRQVDCIYFFYKQSKILKQIYECDDELP